MKNTLRALALALALVASLAACGTGTTPSPATPAASVEPPTNTPEPLPTVASSTPCVNENFPVTVGKRWMYSSTGSPIGPYEFAERIYDAGVTGFTVVSQLRKTPSSVVWECRPEGLVPLGLPPHDATSILAFQNLSEVTLTNVTGVAIPAVITPGMEWSLSFDLQANRTLGDGTVVPVTGHVIITYKAKNRESITVQAGAFDTQPVETFSTIDTVTSKPTGDEKLHLISNYTYYYAAGVGWVKATGAGAIGGQEYYETVELTGYQ
ncbi:MAG: hypothetical protein AB1750_02905 [Chloroflexota bacterium]